MPKDHKKPNIYLLSEVNVADAPADADKSLPRKFSGVANSGKPFNHYGEMVVVDLTDIQYKANVPALLLHDRAQRAGFGTLSVESNQLMMNGLLLDNQFGREVAEESDAGFPWQMSVHVNANSVTELGQNETATVNGAEVTGPLVILKNCSVSEVSFTPTGVDSETNAVALADSGIPKSTTQPNTQKDTTMTPEEIAALQKQVADQAEEIKTLKEEKAELVKEKAEAEAEAKAAAIDAQLSQAGFTKAENGEGWDGIGKATMNMLLSASPEDAKEMIGDLRAPGKQDGTPEWLLSEQHKPSGNGGGQDRQLSSNPMLANAEARAIEASKNYI
ncbi:hypothetical protein [uncultured Psychrobacter sp.]|uniref:hypothetical protein n=1 Tax=uncultured Psychrobacter sp. TaxID=259303 RepID=UPI000E9ECA37|nr:hypothetical protein [Psychrobacter sp.]|tara:strand:+ start:18339 stop:19334 length:996 start_codon:yes stop_codon:yes gene_type:complete